MHAYKSKLDLIATEQAIKFIKDNFEAELARELLLTRVSAPLFVPKQSGLNDDLNGIERSVAFDIRQTGEVAEVVHSLAKWKRHALAVYGFKPHTGLYTDMNAIRRDEDCDEIHSLYVDQWDWEKIIIEQDRTIDYLKQTVNQIYKVIRKVATAVRRNYPQTGIELPDEITFLTTQQLEDEYPTLTPMQRENEVAARYGAVFLIGIGGALRSGTPHDGRAPDYDDWALNGDIIVYNQVLQRAFELSSMGIRVDAQSLKNQLETTNQLHRLEFPFHSALMKGRLPYTIGGGIGQSRLCMLMLEKAHIGEVQSSVWPQSMIEQCEQNNIFLL